AQTRLVFVKGGCSRDKFVFRQRQIPKLLYFLLNMLHIVAALRIDYDKRRGKSRRRYVGDGPVIRGVEGRHSKQTAGRDFRDADDDSTMIVNLKFGADFWIFKLVKFRILNSKKSIFRIDIINVPLNKLRPAIEAGVV